MHPSWSLGMTSSLTQEYSLSTVAQWRLERKDTLLCLMTFLMTKLTLSKFYDHVFQIFIKFGYFLITSHKLFPIV